MALSPTSSRGVLSGATAGGALAGTFPNPTLAATQLPASVWIDPYAAPKNQSGWAVFAVSALFLNGVALQNIASVPPPGDYVEWDVLLASGTWALSVVAEKNTNLGIATITLDGVTVGTIDFYGDGVFAAINRFADVTGIAVATGGVHTLRFQIAAKNASSSNYGGYLQAIGLRRTGS